MWNIEKEDRMVEWSDVWNRLKPETHKQDEGRVPHIIVWYYDPAHFLNIVHPCLPFTSLPCLSLSIF